MTPKATRKPAAAADPFSYLESYDPIGHDVWYKFPIPMPGDPKLKVLFAGRDNPEYTSKIVDLSASARGKELSAAQAINLALENDRAAYPGIIVVGWEGILDTNQKPVAFSRSKCAEFLAKLPEWLMRHLSNYCSKPENFLPVNHPTDADVKAQAEN